MTAFFFLLSFCFSLPHNKLVVLRPLDFVTSRLVVSRGPFLERSGNCCANGYPMCRMTIQEYLNTRELFNISSYLYSGTIY